MSGLYGLRDGYLQLGSIDRADFTFDFEGLCLCSSL